MAALVSPPIHSRVLEFRARPSAPRGTTRPALMAHNVVSFAIPLLDALAIALVSYGVADNTQPAGPHRTFTTIAVSLGIVAFWMRQSGLQNLRRYLRPIAAALQVFPVLLTGLIGEGFMLHWLGAPSGRLWPILIAALSAGLVYLLVSRLFWAKLCEAGLRSGHLAFRVALAGSGCVDWLSNHAVRRNPFLTIVGQYDRDVGSPNKGTGELKRLLSDARRRRIDAIILCYPDEAADRRRQAFSMLRASVSDIFLRDDISRCRLLPKHHPLAEFAVTPLQLRALTDVDMLLKAIIDRVGGAIMLAILAPLLLLTALAIRLESRGPVLFRQPRVGYNNVLFDMFKFRSMHAHMTDNLATRQTMRNDPRITRVGRFIRATSIDELPQLLNVIRGEMSLVGPRPHAPGTNVDGMMLEHAASGYPLRHRVLPGITGWAQVNGSRGALSTPEQLRRRVRLDLYYVEKRSLALDLKIVFLTALREVVSRRAC